MGGMRKRERERERRDWLDDKTALMSVRGTKEVLRELVNETCLLERMKREWARERERE